MNVLTIEIMLPGGPVEFDWKDCGSFGNYCFECALNEPEFIQAIHGKKPYSFSGTLEVQSGKFLFSMPRNEPIRFSLNTDTGDLSEPLSYFHGDGENLQITLRAGA